MSDFKVDVEFGPQVPVNEASVAVNGEKVTVKVSLEVETAALAALSEPVAEAVRREQQQRKNGGQGLLMASGIV